MAFDLGNLLQQYLGKPAPSDTGRELDDFDQVAQSAPRPSMAQGIVDALRSDRTPPFSQLVSELFDRSDATQRAGMLNQLLSGLGPAALASLGGGTLGNLFRGNDTPAAVTPEQAATLTTEQVRQLADDAEKQNPGVVERLGDFYAGHPTLVKTLGGAALAIILGRVAEGMRH